MPTTSFSNIVPYIIFLSLYLASPAAAFGAGSIPPSSDLFGFNGRHGDIATMLLSLPITVAAASGKTKNLNLKRVYFGNWLRDYSQVMDVFLLQKVPEEVLRAIVSILGFMEFGFATREFDITRERLGVYRHEEHIDNPKGYTDQAKAVDSRLRGPVKPDELKIDPKTAMKNYISNESLGISTSSAYIRRELERAIEQGKTGQAQQDERQQYEAFRHLGAALHTLEDFSAHSNYVELCLLLMGKQQPTSALDGVFAYVGDAARFETRAGSAPPIVTGSFGPLDIVESILGEVDDKTATGNLNELFKRMSSGNPSDVTSTIESLQTVLNGLGFQMPQGLSQQIQSLKSSDTANTSQKATWQEVNKNPSGIWDAIEPFFRVRDDIYRWLQESVPPEFSAVTKIIAKISEAIDNMLFSALAAIVGPILGDVRQQLENEKEYLLREQKASTKDLESDIFSPGSKATNPTHSQIAKDHFDNVLNIPAAQVAAVVTKFATEQVIDCWKNPKTANTDQVITSILEALHHPFNIDFNHSDKLQHRMFEAVTKWWDNKTTDQRNILRHRLIKSTIESGQNKYQIPNPAQWGDLRTFGNKPEEDKTMVDQILDNIHGSIKRGLDMPQQTVREIEKIIQSLPTADVPSPVDTALSLLPKVVTLAQTFSGIPPQMILAAPTMGNVLKDILSFSLW